MQPIAIFVVCVACGVAGGPVYDLLYAVWLALSGGGKDPRRAFACRAVCDAAYWLALSAMFAALSAALCFPDVRLYMIAAVFAGALLYNKSLHIIVAFLINKLYNKVTKSVKAGKKGLKSASEGRKA